MKNNCARTERPCDRKSGAGTLWRLRDQLALAPLVFFALEIPGYVRIGDLQRTTEFGEDDKYPDRLRKIQQHKSPSSVSGPVLQLHQQAQAGGIDLLHLRQVDPHARFWP